MAKEKIRDSNFELLRIICMLMIVVLHYMGKGGALGNTAPSEVNFYISHYAEAFSIVAVNCYMMISGYFLIKSEFKLKKIVNLWLEVIFYSIGIYIVLLITGVEHFSAGVLINISFPVLFKEYWFVSGYLVLLLLSPFLNIAIKALNRNQLQKLIIALFAIFVIWGNEVPQGFLFINDGYSLTHFIILYIVAAYIRLYWDFNINKYLYLAGYVFCALMVGCISAPLYKIGDIRFWGSHLLDYSSFAVFISSLCLFMFIREVKVNSPLINNVASLTLAVYLIHEHISLKKILYSDILFTQNYYHSGWFAVHAILSVLFIFIVSIVVEAARKTLFDAIAHIVRSSRDFYHRPIGKAM